MLERNMDTYKCPSCVYRGPCKCSKLARNLFLVRGTTLLVVKTSFAVIRTSPLPGVPTLPIRRDYQRFLSDSRDYWKGRSKVVSPIDGLLADHFPNFNILRQGDSQTRMGDPARFTPEHR